MNITRFLYNIQYVVYYPEECRSVKTNSSPAEQFRLSNLLKLCYAVAISKALRQEALNNGSGAYHIPCTASREYFDHNGCRRIAVFRSARTVHDFHCAGKLHHRCFRGIRRISVHAVPQLSAERMQAYCRLRFRLKFCKRLTGRSGR